MVVNGATLYKLINIPNCEDERKEQFDSLLVFFANFCCKINDFDSSKMIERLKYRNQPNHLCCNNQMNTKECTLNKENFQNCRYNK